MKRIGSMLLTVALCLSLAAPVQAAEGQIVHATIQSPMIFVEGRDATFLDGKGGQRNAITYNGTVYIPFTTAGLWLGADAVWDERAGTVTITSNGGESVYYAGNDFYTMDVKRLEGLEQYREDAKNGVDVQLRPDVTVVVDGEIKALANAMGAPVYPMLFREEIYLPVRSVGEWMGKEVAWLPWGVNSVVHLLDAPSPEELEEAAAYLVSYRERLNAIRTLLTDTYVVHSDQEFYDNMRQIQIDLIALWDLPTPAFSEMAWYVKQLRICTQVMLAMSVDPYLPAEEGSGAAEALGVTAGKMTAYFRDMSPEGKWMHVRSFTVSVLPDYTTNFLTLEDMCTYIETFLAQVSRRETP